MLGWEIVIVRSANKRPFDTPVAGQIIATWRTGPGGTGWLDKLVEVDLAIDLGGNGYPLRYALSVSTLVSALKCGTPRADGPAVVGDNYYLPSDWTETIGHELNELQAAPLGEILLVEAWDQS